MPTFSIYQPADITRYQTSTTLSRMDISLLGKSVAATRKKDNPVNQID